MLTTLRKSDTATKKMPGYTHASQTLQLPEGKYDTLICYHGNCPDGVAAAWMFIHRKGLLRALHGEILFYAVYSRGCEPNLNLFKLDGVRVFIIDFCYPKHIIDVFREKSVFVTIIDHHITAKWIAPDIYLDITRCAAVQTWEYLFCADLEPWWVKYINDRDLNLWIHPNSREFSAALSDMGPPSIKIIERVNNFTEDEKTAFFKRGKILSDELAEAVKRKCRGARLKIFARYRVYTISSCKMRDEVGSVLATDPNCDFALIYNADMSMGRIRWIISMRGNSAKLSKLGLHLGDLAKKYGGDGSCASSGFVYDGNIDNILRPVRGPRFA